MADLIGVSYPAIVDDQFSGAPVSQKSKNDNSGESSKEKRVNLSLSTEFHGHSLPADAWSAGQAPNFGKVLGNIEEDYQI